MSYQTAIARGRKTALTNVYCTATASHGKLLNWSSLDDVVTTATIAGALSTTTHTEWVGYYAKLSRDRAWSNVCGVAFDADGGDYTPNRNILVINSGYVPSVWVDTLPGDASFQPLDAVPYSALGPTNYGTYGPSPEVSYFHDEGFVHPFIRGVVFDPVRDSNDIVMISYGTQLYGATGTVDAMLKGGWA